MKTYHVQNWNFLRNSVMLFCFSNFVFAYHIAHMMLKTVHNLFYQYDLCEWYVCWWWWKNVFHFVFRFIVPTATKWSESLFDVIFHCSLFCAEIVHGCVALCCRVEKAGHLLFTGSLIGRFWAFTLENARFSYNDFANSRCSRIIRMGSV